MLDADVDRDDEGPVMLERVRGRADRIELRWWLLYNHGRKPRPRVRLTERGVLLDATILGPACLCTSAVRVYETVVEGLPPGELRVFGDTFDFAVDLPTGTVKGKLRPRQHPRPWDALRP